VEQIEPLRLCVASLRFHLGGPKSGSPHAKLKIAFEPRKTEAAIGHQEHPLKPK
jgi:hypothetical protein